VATSRAFEILACSGLCAMGLARLTPSMCAGLSEHSLPESSHQEVSEDAKPPCAGPGFLRLNSIAYRLEMLLITILLLVILFYWRLFVVKDLNLLATVFWIIFPAQRLSSLLALRCAEPGNGLVGDLDSTTSSIRFSSGFLSLRSGAYCLEPCNGRFLDGRVILLLTVLSDTISEQPQRRSRLEANTFTPLGAFTLENGPNRAQPA
jgi:hypothetical protein